MARLSPAAPWAAFQRCGEGRMRARVGTGCAHEDEHLGGGFSTVVSAHVPVAAGMSGTAPAKREGQRGSAAPPVMPEASRPVRCQVSLPPRRRPRGQIGPVPARPDVRGRPSGPRRQSGLVLAPARYVLQGFADWAGHRVAVGVQRMAKACYVAGRNRSDGDLTPLHDSESLRMGRREFCRIGRETPVSNLIC